MERTIKPQDLKATLDDVTLIDVRRKSDLDNDTVSCPAQLGMTRSRSRLGPRNCPRIKKSFFIACAAARSAMVCWIICAAKASARASSKAASSRGEKRAVR